MYYTLVVDLECRFISSVFSVAQRNVDHFHSGSVRWWTSKLDSLLHFPMLFTLWTYVWWSCCCLGHARLSICVVKTTLCTPLMTVSPSLVYFSIEWAACKLARPSPIVQVPACDQTLGSVSSNFLQDRWACWFQGHAWRTTAFVSFYVMTFPILQRYIYFTRKFYWTFIYLLFLFKKLLGV